MLKKMRKLLAFLLVMTVVLSLTSQTAPRILAEELNVTDVNASEESPPETEQLAEEQQEAKQEEVQVPEQQESETPEPEQPEAELQKSDQQEMIQQEEVPEAKILPEERKGAEAGISVQSIHVVTDPEEHFTADYKFYDEDEQTILNEQILSAGEILQEPEHAEKEHKKFLGWYQKTGNTWTKFEAFGIAESAMSANREVCLYAHYEEVYYVYYKASADVNSKIIFTQTYKNGETISAAEVPFHTPENYALTGWTTEISAVTPQEGLKIQNSDITLYPVLKTAKWITFDTQGGNVVDPQYVLAGEVTKEPSEPKRAGYSFAGWYTEKECETAFGFGNTLENDITLYAKWSPVKMTYTVIYWQENPDDTGYSFKESVQKNGMTGTSTAAKADKKYDGFTQSTKKTIQQQTIAGDGSTVVHVYYDRNVYSIYFMGRNNGKWTRIDKLTITAKYGADISKKWPSKLYPDEYGANWKISENATTYQAGIETMPLNGDTFYKLDNTGTKYRADYYVEALDGTYVLDHSDKYQKQYTGEYLKTSEEDYYDIKGFTVKMNGNPSSPPVKTIASKQEGFENDTYGWKFYYTRNSYNIEFHNDGQIVANKTYKYQADISQAGFTPNPPKGKEDYTFAGWYANELGEGDAYDFKEKKMPANNLILYAKWVPATYKVTFDLNGANLEEQEEPTAYETQIVAKAQNADKPEDPVRTGYRFTGWTRAGKPFHFNTQITEDTTLTAQWVSEAQYSITYNPNGAVTESGTPAESFVDPEKYAEDAKAKISNVPAEWKTPDEEKVFLGWAEQADGSGTIYYESDLYQMPAQDVILYAVWGNARKTTLVYDYNGGLDGADKSSQTVTIEIPNQKYAIALDGSGIKKDGYYFVGWSVSKEGEKDDLLQKGDVIQVDTIEQEKNILYAQWEKEIPTPTGITENVIPFAVMVLCGAAFCILIPRRRKI